ncbi:MAG TPA: conjugal transfer protein TraF [Gammaproteobacteria bacterium]
MSRLLGRVAFVTAIITTGSAAFALPFDSFDPRSMAMGGAGVAVGDAAMAPFFNPALLAVTDIDDDFSINLPVVGARIYDPEDFEDSLTAFQDAGYLDSLDGHIQNYNYAAYPTSNDLRLIASDASTLSTQLTTLNDKPLQMEAGAALVMAIPSRKFGGAFYANGWAVGGAVANYRDDATLQEFTDTLNAVADCYDTNAVIPGSCNPVTDIPNYSTYFDATTGDVTFDSTDLKSSVDMRGVTVTETGVALARQFGEGAGSWTLGITPKYVKLRLYEYRADVKSADTEDFDGDDYKAEYSHTNFDIGLAKNYNNGWRSGFVIKNVIAHTYDFKNVPRDPLTNTPLPDAASVSTGTTLNLKPQARLGVSHQNKWSTVALDVDLTDNDPAGFEKRTRYIALGGELNGWDWVQLRAGYRINTFDSARNVASLGLGLAAAGTLHIDVAMANSSNETGAALQLGLQF